MKKNVRRILSAVLVLCTLLTYLPAVVTATEEASAQPITYNFDLRGTDLKTTAGQSMGGASLNNAPTRDAIAQYYADGTLGWKYAANNAASFATETRTAESIYYFGGGSQNYLWQSLRMGHRTKEGSEAYKYPAGFWTALTVRAPGAGYYNITLEHQIRADGTPKGEVYLIKGALTDVAAIDAQLTPENLLKTVDFSHNSNTDMPVLTKELGMVELEAGEYTMVFRAMEAKPGGAYCYIKSLQFAETEPPAPKEPLQVKQLEYDFVLNKETLVDALGKTFGGRKLTEQKVQEALAEYYDDRTIHWMYAGNNAEVLKTEDTKISDMYYIGNGTGYKWDGLRLGLKTEGPDLADDGSLKSHYYAGWWTAMTIESPGKGKYYFSLEAQTRGDATAECQVYLIKGKLTDPAQIEAAMTEKNMLVEDLNCKNRDMFVKTFDLGAVNMEQGEYTLVFKAMQESAGGAFMYLNKLTAKHESIMPPPGPNKVVYDFDLNDRETGVYEKRTDLKDCLDDLTTRYNKGKIRWNYFTKDNTMADTGHCFASAYGMYMFALEGQWMAFKIKSPGQGTYTLTLNHARGGNGGTGAVYILPGNTEDIPAAMDFSNRINKVIFYNDSGDPAVTDGFVTQLGTWDFAAGEEYIVVMEALDNSPYKARNSYMWISQIIAEEGDHMVEQETERKINSVVVSETPITQFGMGMYGAVSQVYGQDYFYFPTEGSQMLIFNLDDMSRVRKVATPFTSPKGMCVDDDGMIWMVGDAQVVWRYDPYTNTGWTSANYKTTYGIEDSSTGLYCTSASDGNIYFGTYTKGYVVRFDTKTEKFSKVTGGLINPDSSYASGLIERDGYLYAGINGDRNADGKVTAEYVKIDLATDKIVGRTDITELFGQNEVMIRGVGICGDVLFAGGIEMEGFVAIDINTMTLRTDFDIHKQIHIATTEEIDGKVYFVVSGQGIRMYDSATDTITVPAKMETATAGFRCGETNAVTLDHDPLFPGVSYITYSGTGIKIYNVESGMVYTPPLIDDEKDGAGQVIRTIIRGPEGTNTLYIGGFNTDTSAVYDIKQGKVTKLFDTAGQTDVLMWYEGALYAGNYPGAYITRVNLEDAKRNVILLSLSKYYGQARVHAITAADGMLFAGTIPDWYGYGGTFVAMNLNQLDDRVMIEQMVEHQSIIGLVHRDGYVFGATSLAGGTAADEPYNDTVSAKIFVYDVQGKKKVAELDLREHIDGLPNQLPYIDLITVDPNGQLWGVIDETIFQFDFDPATCKFTVKEIVSYNKTGFTAEGRSWKMGDVDYKDGYMYVALGNKGGFRKININDPSDNTRINCETPRNFVIGEDGNLYYALNSYEMKMYPLNVTEDDWKVAESVDAKLLALQDIVDPLADRAKIEATKAAYEALSWEHKALIQNHELLQIALIDLLEARIDDIGEVTMEKKSLIDELNETYNALPLKQKRYVKNYQILNAADLKLQDIVNNSEANRVQDIINTRIPALGEITLEDEEAIKAIRAEYDALTFLQKSKVDTTLLLNAEAKIRQLRDEKIEYLKQLIASIGEVTLEDEAVITEAMAIWDWMDRYERERVDFVTLNTAEKQLTKLQKEAAAKVDALILAIGETIDHSSKDAIEAARKAYDALTPGSKQYVKNLSILTEAEAIYAELGMNPTTLIIIIAVAGGVLLAAAAVVVILVLKKKKAAVPAKAEETAEEETPAEPEA